MADIVKQLVESKQTATAFKKDLAKEDKKKYKDQIKLSKDIINKIDDLIAVFIWKNRQTPGYHKKPRGYC